MNNLLIIKIERVWVFAYNTMTFVSTEITFKLSGRKSVSFQAWFSANGEGDFVRIKGNLNTKKYLEILGDELLPSIHEKFPGRQVKLIQDMSLIHQSRLTKRLFEDPQGVIELLS